MVRNRFHALRASAFSIALLSQLQGEVNASLALTATVETAPVGQSSQPATLIRLAPAHVGFASSSPQILLTTTDYVRRLALVSTRIVKPTQQPGLIPNLLTTTLAPVGAQPPFKPVDLTPRSSRRTPQPEPVPSLLTSTLFDPGVPMTTSGGGLPTYRVRAQPSVVPNLLTSTLAPTGDTGWGPLLGEGRNRLVVY
jgi:hypothetical protein